MNTEELLAAAYAARSASQARAAPDRSRTVFLGEPDVRALLEGPGLAPWQCASQWHDVQDLHVVVDLRSLAVHGGIDALVRRLKEAPASVRDAPARLRVFVLAHGLAEAPCGESTALDELIAAAVDPLLEVRRRIGEAPRRWTMTLAPEEDTSVHMLCADTVAEFLMVQAATLDPGVHVLHAAAAGTQHGLVRAVAEQAGIVLHEAAAHVQDAAAELVLQAVKHACAMSGFVPAVAAEMAAAEHTCRWHCLAAPGEGWQERVADVVRAREAAQTAAAAMRFTDVPQMQCRVTDEGVRYLRCGTGAEAVLLINAFGLSLDFWAGLAQSMSAEFTVLAIDDAAPAQAADSLPRTYYATPDSAAGFIAAVQAMLRAEGLRTCHVASWCSGAKLAFELARCLRGSIASLSLLAPSFAGEQATAGADSSFEASLHTLCKVVERTPRSAEAMAKSMMALLAKGQDAPQEPASATLALCDARRLADLQRPFSSGPRMLEYSRQVLNFRGHQLGSNADGARLALPVLLVTGERDSATCAVRAADVCSRLCEALHLELSGASHYFIHQNPQLVARLLSDFIRQGRHAAFTHPRVSRIGTLAVHEELVSGEL